MIYKNVNLFTLFLWSITRSFKYNWASHELNLDFNILHWAPLSYSREWLTVPWQKDAEKIVLLNPLHTLQLEVYSYNNLNVNYCHIFENNSIVPPKLFVSRTVLARAGNTRGTDLSPDLQHIWPGIKLSHYPCTQSGQAASQTGSWPSWSACHRPVLTSVSCPDKCPDCPHVVHISSSIHQCSRWPVACPMPGLPLLQQGTLLQSCAGRPGL